MIFEKVYRLRLNYKSGNYMEIDTTEYSVSPSKISFTAAKNSYTALHINYDEVESVWLVKVRTRLAGFN